MASGITPCCKQNVMALGYTRNNPVNYRICYACSKTNCDLCSSGRGQKPPCPHCGNSDKSKIEWGLNY